MVGEGPWVVSVSASVNIPLKANCLPIPLLCASSTGDLTDAKYADLRGSMQYVEEWSDYQRVLQRSGVLKKTVWFDIRGNHGNQLLH